MTPETQQKEKLTEIVFVIDRSGSMAGLEKDTIGGFNSTIAKQKKEEGEAIVSTVLFSNDIQILHDRVKIENVKEMTDKEYYVTASTALLDAVGSTIQRIDRIHKDPVNRRPDVTLFVIITDGYENSSREFTYRAVKDLIEEHKKSGWDFMFLGANIDVAMEAERIGISIEKAVSYKCDHLGIEYMYDCIDDNLKSARKTGRFKKKDLDFER